MPKGIFERKTKPLNVPIEELKSLIASGVRMSEIARRYRDERRAIGKVLDSLGIPRPPAHSCPGSLNPAWNGGRKTDKDGYILIYRPDHPSAVGGGNGRAGYVREHRLVMEGVLGRHLTASEVVHHKDSNRKNNTPENLELFSTNAEHLAMELKGRVPKWGQAGFQKMVDGWMKNKGKSPSTETRKRMSQAHLRTSGKL